MSSGKEMMATKNGVTMSSLKTRDEDEPLYSFAFSPEKKKSFLEIHCTSRWNLLWAFLFLVNFVFNWICLGLLLQLRSDFVQIQNGGNFGKNQHIASGEKVAFQYQRRGEKFGDVKENRQGIELQDGMRTSDAKGEKDALNQISPLCLRACKGEKGDAGSPGLPGNNGTMGINGFKGEPGPRGRTGNKGEKGDIGQPGLNGRGIPGQAGINGNKGEKGSTGPAGSKGERGESCDDAKLSALKESVNQLRTRLNGRRVRLVGGPDASGGRVEIRHNKVWGTICDDGWDDNDGAVVCRMLGFSGVISARGSAFYGQGNGTIWLAGVNCNGSENEIEECGNVNWGSHRCGHIEDASVTCHL